MKNIYSVKKEIYIDMWFPLGIKDKVIEGQLIIYNNTNLRNILDDTLWSHVKTKTGEFKYEN
jgi:hypothetical protein